MRLIRWLASSLGGHVLFAGVVAGIPFFLLFIPMLRTERGLTPTSLTYLALWSFGLWGLGGALFWYLFAKPRRERRGVKSRE